MDFRQKLQEFLEDYQQMRKTQNQYFTLKKKTPGLAQGVLIRSKEQEKDLDKAAEQLISEIKESSGTTAQYTRSDMRKAFDAGCDREAWIRSYDFDEKTKGPDAFSEFIEKIEGEKSITDESKKN